MQGTVPITLLMRVTLGMLNILTRSWGLRAPLELGLEVVLRSLGGGEFVLGGDAELPRLSILFDSFAAKHILNFVSNH